MVKINQGGGGGGSAFPTNLYIDGPSSLTQSAVKTVTHNMAVTQADVEAGRYKVLICGGSSGNGFQLGDVYAGATLWGANSGQSPAANHFWNAGDPGLTDRVYWQSNTIKILVGATAIVDARIIIQQMY